VVPAFRLWFPVFVFAWAGSPPLTCGSLHFFRFFVLCHTCASFAGMWLTFSPFLDGFDLTLSLFDPTFRSSRRWFFPPLSFFEPVLFPVCAPSPGNPPLFFGHPFLSLGGAFLLWPPGVPCSFRFSFFSFFIDDGKPGKFFCLCQGSFLLCPKFLFLLVHTPTGFSPRNVPEVDSLFFFLFLGASKPIGCPAAAPREAVPR